MIHDIETTHQMIESAGCDGPRRPCPCCGEGPLFAVATWRYCVDIDAGVLWIPVAALLHLSGEMLVDGSVWWSRAELETFADIAFDDKDLAIVAAQNEAHEASAGSAERWEHLECLSCGTTFACDDAGALCEVPFGALAET